VKFYTQQPYQHVISL